MKFFRSYFRITIASVLVLLACNFSQVMGQNRPVPSQNQLNKKRIDDQSDTRTEERKRSQLYSAARRLESRQAFQDAYNIYSDLFNQVPEKNEYYDGLRRTLIALNRFDEAIQLIQSRKSSQSRAYSPVKREAQLGEVYYRMGDKETALQHWAIALDKAPQSMNTYQVVASIMIQQRLLDEAVSVYQKGRNLLKNDELFSINLATLHQARMDWLNAAREYLKTLHAASSRQSFVRRGLANFPDTREADSAIELIVKQELKESKDKNYWDGYRLVLREILVDNYMKKGKFLQALSQVEKYELQDKALGEKLLTFAGDCLEESQDSVAVLALEKASNYLVDREGVAIINLTLADIETKYGRYANADSLLSSLLTQHPQGIIRFLTLYKRGMNRLYGLESPESAIPDFRNIVRENRQENEEMVNYHLAVAYARTMKYDEALSTLNDIMKSKNAIRNRYLPELGEYQEADPVMLASRIALWSGDKTTAESLLDSLVTSPKGSNAENEALELLYLISVAQDTQAVETFTNADRYEFLGDDSKALVLYDSLTTSSDSTLAMESLWRKTLIESRLGDETALDTFIVNHYDHPRAETAVFIKMGRLMNQNRNDETIQLLEDYLVNTDTGVLASLARRRLDELKAISVLDNSRE